MGATRRSYLCVFWVNSLGLLVLCASAPPVWAGNYAFLVACSDYDKKELRPLQFTQNDITEFSKSLREAGFPKDNIVLMHDQQPRLLLPEGRKIREQLDLLLSRVGRKDSLVVALSGHGVQFAGEKHSYFCPVDARVKDRTTLIALDEVYECLEKCKAGRKLLLVDACRNDPQSGLNRSRAEVDLESVTRPQAEAVPEGIVALFSCSAGQQSYEYPELKHGIFFHNVLEGLKGQADKDGDGKITLDELTEYAKEKTQAFAHLNLSVKQSPQQKGEFSGVWVLREINRAVARFVQGKEALAKQDYRRATEELTAAIEIDPKFADAYAYRSEAYSSTGDYDKMIEDCTEAIRLDPKHALAYNNRGFAYIEKKQFDLAIPDLDEAIRLDPKSFEAYNNRGWAYNEKKEFDRAIPDLDEAIRINPKYHHAYNNRGWAYNEKKQPARAIQDLNEAIRINPRYGMAHNNRGWAYMELQQYDRAVADFTKAIRLEPKSSLAHSNRGWAYSEMGDNDRAIQDVSEAIRLDPQNPLRYNARGNIYWKLKDYEQCIADYTMAIRCNPQFAVAYSNRANAYQMTGNIQRAQADRAKALRLDPSLDK